MKPGYKTSEFWLTLATAAIGLVAVLWGLSPAEQADIVRHVEGAIVAVGGLVANAYAVWKYVEARTALKMVSSPASDVDDEDPDAVTVDISE